MNRAALSVIGASAALAASLATVVVLTAGASSFSEAYTVDQAELTARLSKHSSRPGVLLELHAVARPDAASLADGAEPRQWTEHILVTGPNALALIASGCILDDSQRPLAFPQPLPDCPAASP